MKKAACAAKFFDQGRTCDELFAIILDADVALQKGIYSTEYAGVSHPQRSD
jgi:hypothetical protein